MANSAIPTNLQTNPEYIVTINPLKHHALEIHCLDISLQSFVHSIRSEEDQIRDPFELESLIEARKEHCSEARVECLDTLICGLL